MFPDIKTYFDFDNTNKTCQLCNDGRPLKTYTKCDGCQKFFCLKHRPMFQQQWFCPFCEENFKNGQFLVKENPSPPEKEDNKTCLKNEDLEDQKQK